MKISTLLKMMIVCLIVLSVSTFGSLYFLKESIDERNKAIEEQIEFKDLVQDLSDSSDYLTNQVREYVQFGERVHFDNYWREVNETKTRDNVVKRLKELNTPTELLNLVEKAKNNSDALINLEDKAMKAVENGEMEAARKYVFGQEYEQGKKQIQLPMKEFEEKLKKLAEGNAKASLKNMMNLFIVSITLIILLVVVLSSFISILFKKLGKPLSQVTLVANKVAEGNLSVKPIINNSKDEVAELSSSINEMVKNLRVLVNNIKESSSLLAASSEEFTASAEQSARASEMITLTTQEAATSSEEQMKGMEETASAIEQMFVGIQQAASSSAEVTKVAENASKTSEEGMKAVESIVVQMNDIDDTVKGLSEIINGLGNRSNEIGNIVGLITDISAQTNLLALNAAIEAARAGEHGKGFSVVADEVRKLAEQSAESARQISQLVTDIQKETLLAVESMEKGTIKVKVGIEKTEQVTGAFKEIENSVHHVSGNTQEVSATMQQLAAGSEQIVNSIDLVKGATEKVAAMNERNSAATQEQLATMEEIKTSAETLSKLAENLQEDASKFIL